MITHKVQATSAESLLRRELVLEGCIDATKDVPWILIFFNRSPTSAPLNPNKVGLGMVCEAVWAGIATPSSYMDHAPGAGGTICLCGASPTSCSWGHDESGLLFEGWKLQHIDVSNAAQDCACDAPNRVHSSFWEILPKNSLKEHPPLDTLGVGARGCGEPGPCPKLVPKYLLGALRFGPNEQKTWQNDRQWRINFT